MNKKLTAWTGIVGLPLIVIWLIIPLILGISTERKCRQWIKFLNSSALLHGTITRYHHGWFSSQATVQLTPVNLPQDDPRQSLTIQADIQHGPFTMDWSKIHLIQALVTAHLVLTPEQLQWLACESNLPPIATVQIRLDWNGEITLDLVSPALELHNTTHQLIWHGLQAKLNYTPYQKFTTEFHFAGAELVAGTTRLKLGEANLHHQSQKDRSGFWLNQSNFTLDNYLSQSDSGHRIEVDDFNLQSQTTRESTNDTANLAVTIVAKRTALNGAPYEKSRIHLELTQLTAELLASLTKSLVTLPLGITSTTQEIELMVNTFCQGGRLNLTQLFTTTPWGAVYATAQAHLNHPINHPWSWLSILTNGALSIKFKTEPALIVHLLEKFYRHTAANPALRDQAPRRAQTTLQEWRRSGKLLTFPDRPETEINFEYLNNQILINQKPLSLTLQGAP